MPQAHPERQLALTHVAQIMQDNAVLLGRIDRQQRPAQRSLGADTQEQEGGENYFHDLILAQMARMPGAAEDDIKRR